MCMCNKITYLLLSEGRLTWHSGLIPPDEIWVKIGGDKGQGSMKTSFQICNVPHPNSFNNSAISIFEAGDTATNLNIALSHTGQLPVWEKEMVVCVTTILTNAHLNVKCPTNRDKTARVFLCGDYAFLCLMYGLSGASGLCYSMLNYMSIEHKII